MKQPICSRKAAEAPENSKANEQNPAAQKKGS